MIGFKDKRRFKVGDRIRIAAWGAGVPIDTLGTVALVATFGGKSVYPDPMRSMVFAHWDNGQRIGVFRAQVVKEPRA